MELIMEEYTEVILAVGDQTFLASLRHKPSKNVQGGLWYFKLHLPADEDMPDEIAIVRMP